jgi:NADH-quinone oxidoreductase subunit N
VLTALLAFFLLSLIGIPFTGGFFGKFYVFTSALQAGHAWLAVIGLINSGVACFYYLKLLASVYAKPEAASSMATGDASSAKARITAPAGIALALAAGATLMLGILPGRILHLADSASATLNADRLRNMAAGPIDIPTTSSVVSDVKQ